MRKSRFTESQILAILGEGGAGLAVAEVCRKHCISTATYYQWKSMYAGLSANELEMVKKLEAENASHQGCSVPKVVTPIAKRAAVEIMVNEHGLSRAKACRTAKLSRSAFDKATVDRLSKDAPVVDALNEIVSKRARRGFWKCFTRLRADGKPWNHKRVFRVYCDRRLTLKRKAKKRLTTRERQRLAAADQRTQPRMGLGLHA